MRPLRVVLLVAAALAAGACGGEAVPEFHRPAVFVLGMDGLDPALVEKEMSAGNMPHFKAFAAGGDFIPLGTSLPPESPVAWANFITGRDPGGHGIFDFIHRRPTPRGVSLYSSMAEAEPPSSFVWFFGYRLPLSPGGVRNLVKGKVFWEHLSAAGVPVSIFRVPDNFPPKETGAFSISGMGTPDLLGTQGEFSYYSEVAPENLERFSGKCAFHLIELEDGVARAWLIGPENTYAYPDERTNRSPASRVPLVIYADRERGAARIDVGEERTVLAEGEWSDWVPVSFPLIPNFASVPGMVRLYLQSVEPHVKLYVSPINVDPRDPAQPVGTPEDASRRLAGAIGPYYTQGMAEETNGARLEVFDSGEFIDQTDLVLEERHRMLDFALDRFGERGGFTFFYYSSSDLAAHILYQHIDPDHPRYDPELAARYGGSISNVYREMDDVLGKVLRSVPEGTRVVVMSDHGFASLRRKVSLNTWLYENDFLELRYPDRQGEMTGFMNVEWMETKAYAVGFQGIYLNLYGREPQGLVSQGNEAERIKERIIRGLEALRDPETGERMITKVYRREEVYHGDQLEDAPDLVIGFNRGYENMDESALGTVPRALVEDNTDAWSGSHLMDPSHVPGVLLANTEFAYRRPRLTDLTVTILAEYGIEVDDLPGRRIW